MTANPNVIAMKLRAFNVTNGRQLAAYTDAPAVIYFLANRDAGDPRAELHRRGISNVVIYRPHGAVERTFGAMRTQTVDDAIAGASKRLGLTDWRKSPFGNCWLPVESINRMNKLLGVESLAV